MSPTRFVAMFVVLFALFGVPCFSLDSWSTDLSNGFVQCNIFSNYGGTNAKCFFRESFGGQGYNVLYPVRYGAPVYFDCNRCSTYTGQWVCVLNVPGVINARCSYDIRFWFNSAWSCQTYSTFGYVDNQYHPNRLMCNGCQDNILIYQPNLGAVCCNTALTVLSRGTCCWNRNKNQCLCSQGTFCSSKYQPVPVAPTKKTKPPKPPVKRTTPKPAIRTKPPPKPTTKPTTTTKTTTKKTTTVTTPTTTKPARKVCTDFRILNGKKANACDYPGATRILNQFTKTNEISACNAVFLNIMYKGKKAPAFYTSNACHLSIQDFAKKKKKNNLKAELNFEIGNGKVPMNLGSMFDPVAASSGSGWYYVVKKPFRSMLLGFQGPCRLPACTVSKETIDLIDYSKCELVSYGYVNKKFDYNGLQKADVELTHGALCLNADAIKNSDQTDKGNMCFRNKEKKNLFCAGDGAAPVYCYSKANEKVFIGVAAQQNFCDKTDVVNVIPYPLDKPSRANQTP